MTEKFEQVMAEIPYVRECLGWIPLVTPTSQIVGTQAMLNVKFGRWKNLAPAAADIALGKYGRTPGPVSQELLALIAQRSGQKPIEGRPADALAPRMPKLREELAAAGLPTDDEACVLHAMFPVEFAKLYKKPAAPAPAAAPAAAAPVAPTPAVAPVTVISRVSASGSNGQGRGQRMALTVEGHRTEVLVEEV
jgi:oxaloacetate decarboxylase alpha subunit/pyruvate carboxylase subunit B